MADRAPNDHTPGPRLDQRAAAAELPFAAMHIDHIVLRCRDVSAMLAFYCTVLGLEVAKRNERLGLIHLRAGSAMIDLIPAQPASEASTAAAASIASGNMDHFCLRIEPFDAARLQSYFAARGIACGELRARFGAEGDGESLYIHDPEGNRVELKGPSRPTGA